MTEVPLRGRGYRYSGRDEDKRRATAAKNRAVAEITRHANRLLADNPRELQQLSFHLIATELGYELETVRHAIGDGGANGLTVRITEEQRKELDRIRASN